MLWALKIVSRFIKMGNGAPLRERTKREIEIKEGTDSVAMPCINKITEIKKMKDMDGGKTP
jgi:hypothetical protein